jgi:predicted transcriptional regulator
MLINNIEVLNLASYGTEVESHRLPLSSKYRTSNLLRLNKKYRSHFEIVALMLEAMKGNGATGFSVMKHASVNSSQLKKYLRCLTEIEFIDMDTGEGQVFYRASKKGLDFLGQYYVLLGMLLNAYTRNEPYAAIYQEVKCDSHTGQQSFITRSATS